MFVTSESSLKLIVFMFVYVLISYYVIILFYNMPIDDGKVYVCIIGAL